MITCALAACVDSAQPSVATYELSERYPPTIGLVFVLDDTGAMEPYQTQLAALPAMTQQVFEQLPFGMPSMRFVVATSTGRRDYELIDYLDFEFGRTRNYQGTLTEALAQRMNVGTAGQSNTMLLGMYASYLDDIVRETYFLGIVFVAASDDASNGAASDFAGHVIGLGAPELSVSLIAKEPAARLEAFASAFPSRSTSISIDESDWTQAIGLIGHQIEFPLDVLCFQAPADVDPNTPGPQYDCTMTATWIDERVLPECREDGPEPCWYFQRDSVNCTSRDSVVLKVRGYGAGYYHPRIRGQCLVK